MTEEAEPIFDNKKLLEKITKIEEITQEILSIQKEYQSNNDTLLQNKEFINYLYEHQNVKDLNFYMLYPNLSIISDDKNGVFHEIERKDSIPYIQNIISNCTKNKKNIEVKLNDTKKKLINIIEDPSEMEILDKEIFDIMLPLASKKFPNYFKSEEEEDDED